MKAYILTVSISYLLCLIGEKIICARNNKLNYFIYASKNTIINEIDNKERYLISKDYYSNHKEVIDEKIKEKVEIIIEAFDGLVLDRNIAEES